MIGIDMPMPVDCRVCPLEAYYVPCGQTRCRVNNKVIAVLEDSHQPIPWNGKPEWCPLVDLAKYEDDLK